MSHPRRNAITAAVLQEFLGGTLLGNAARVIRTIANLIPGEETALSFCKYEEPARALPLLKESRSAVVICSNALAAHIALDGERAYLLADDPRLAFTKAAWRYFVIEDVRPGIHPTAIVHTGARVHETAEIGPYCVIGSETEIGRDSVLVGHVSVLCPTKIGARVRVWPGTVIGGDGFGYYPDREGELYKFPHVGGVVIEDDVEIGSNTSIDRGALGNTVLGEGTKVDNLVHIAHNVIIGKHCRIICHVGIGGSVRIGDRAYLGIGALVKNQKTIGADALIGMGAVVVKDVPANTTVIGNPARPIP